MRNRDKMIKAFEAKVQEMPYEFVHYKKFDYEKLKYIPYLYTAGQGERTTYNDVIIMIDTETSKKKPDTPYIEKGKLKYKTGENHVVAWTLSIRAFHHNICTLYGRKPSTLASCMLRIHTYLRGDKTVFYCHNLGYDHVFCRKFWYRLYGFPEHQLNVKPYCPILIQFENGIILKDSLILAQRKLEKWAEDLDVEHKKQVGKWDYDKIRNQNTPMDADELSYIEGDTLAGVECIDKTMETLHKKIYSMPLTATGVPREQTRKRGKPFHAHDAFSRMALSLEQYKKFLQIFHGGFTHGNRHFVNTLIQGLIQCFDFASSYPYIMCAFKFPMEKFTPFQDCSADFIVNNMEETAFAFKFIAVNIRLKSDFEPMPCLQFSKCLKTINAIQDNGRILCANYVEIYLTEYDLAVIKEMYTWDKHICTEVETATKDYLPKWFTDFVYESFGAKTQLKGSPDVVLYQIKKALVNCLYGMCVQCSLSPDIIEDYDTGEYTPQEIENEEEEYNKYLNKINTILPYQWGVYVTSIGFFNIHQLIKCCNKPYYSDTDSCYGSDWDYEKVNAYNEGCKAKLKANGYGPVIKDGKEYWLGVAETEGDKDKYTEFKYMGAKRYCGRCVADGKLHLTVAGVPKKKGAECLEEDISNFTPGFVFPGTKTGKKTHIYFYVPEIYIDKNGNETGDSISLIPCDYELDCIERYDWMDMFTTEVEIQIYDEEQ